MRGPSSRISAHFEQFGAGTISTRRAFTVPHSSPPLKGRVFRLQPRARPAADVTRPDPLRDNAFAVHLAGVPEDAATIPSDRLAELDALGIAFSSRGAAERAYSITSSARASSIGGKSSALADLALTIS